MPRPNRVTPFGVIEADPARGALMGNRGCLVDASGELVRGWRGQRWITCLLEFKDRPPRRPLMAPGRYTELFFLDEATACAAGHRPCCECRRADATAFLAAWRKRHPADTRMAQVDARLHAERTSGAHARAVCAELPDGTMVSLDEQAWLVADGALHAWTHAGYAGARPLPSEHVTVLTPPSTVAAMQAGWRPTGLPARRPAGRA